MNRESDADRQSAKLDKTSTRYDLKVTRLAKELEQAKVMQARVIAEQVARASGDAREYYARMLRAAQGDYMREKRMDFGMPRKVDKSVAPPVPYRIFEAIYKAWIRARKPVIGVAVDYATIARITGCDTRRNKDLVLELVEDREHKHLFRCGGGKGRGNRLMVIPTGYPVETDHEGHFSMSEDLAKAHIDAQE